MSHADRKRWISELRRTNSKSIDAPTWLWKSVVDLVGSHEVGYLEHCGRTLWMRADLALAGVRAMRESG
jgi:hypothetical protein